MTVNYATADVPQSGFASVADNDYVPTSGVLTFGPGETQKTFTVVIVGDTTVEPVEGFRMNLSNPSISALLGSQIFYIYDDD